MTLDDGDGARERLEALERENRALRRTNESLLAALAHAGCATPPLPSVGTCAGADEGASWEAALEGEAPWETVLVPRGTSR